ncbi:MAG TPA: alpha/beta hydrolase-fold protein [Anaerolineales bacterium]|nr:alpha/beta hydrolase-fold protein [Anaerolineales bacterium]
MTNLHPLLVRAQTESVPLIDGTTATFIWQGETAPHLAGDFTYWGEPNAPVKPVFEQVAPQLWKFSLELPLASHWEYCYFADSQLNGRTLDPLNPRLLTNGMQLDLSNNYFSMPGYQPTRWVNTPPLPLHGRLSQHTLEVPGALPSAPRPLWLYQPATDQSVPLLVVLDGRDYLERGRIVEIVDGLIAAGKMRPIALALLENADESRTMEYAANPLLVGILALAVIPLAEQHLNLLDYRQQPGTHAILGTSMGGLMALFSGLYAPQLFGKVFASAGAYVINGFDMPTLDMVRYYPHRPIEIWMECGSHDFLLSANRKMLAELQAHGYTPSYREYPGAHNYTCWRDQLANGLMALFPPE